MMVLVEEIGCGKSLQKVVGGKWLLVIVVRGSGLVECLGLLSRPGGPLLRWVFFCIVGDDCGAG